MLPQTTKVLPDHSSSLEQALDPNRFTILSANFV